MQKTYSPGSEEAVGKGPQNNGTSGSGLPYLPITGTRSIQAMYRGRLGFQFQIQG